jgi:hypothetical protein
MVTNQRSGVVIPMQSVLAEPRKESLARSAPRILSPGHHSAARIIHTHRSTTRPRNVVVRSGPSIPSSGSGCSTVTTSWSATSEPLKR